MAFVSGNKHIFPDEEIYSLLKIGHVTNFQNYKLVSVCSIGPSGRGTLQAGGHIFFRITDFFETVFSGRPIKARSPEN